MFFKALNEFSIVVLCGLIFFQDISRVFMILNYPDVKRLH